MTYKCDIKFMAVQSRMCNVTKLCTQLGLSVSDVAIDKEMSGLPLRTSQTAFSLPYEDGVTHRLVLQDDLVINPYLKESIQTLVNRFPDNPICLYTYKKKDNIEKGVYKLHFMTAPALIMPRRIMNEINNEYRQYPMFIHDDWFYSWYCRRNGIIAYGVIPNLVTIDLSVESVLAHKTLSFYTDLCFTDERVDIDALEDRTKSFCDGYINLSDKEFEEKLRECN